MAITLPTPIRVAAGLVGSALDHLENLPQELPALGVSLAGQAFRVSLRVRQQVAALAVRGDDLLSGISGRPEEKPAWATFDEEEPVTPPPNGRPGHHPPPRDSAPTPPAPPTAPRAAAPPAAPRTRPATPPAAPRARPATPPAATDPLSPARSDAYPPAGSRARTPRPRVARATTGTSPKIAARPDDAGIGTGAASDEDLLAMPLSTLHAQLPDMSEPQVRALLAREESGRGRAAHLTLLQNRLTTLDLTER